MASFWSSKRVCVTGGAGFLGRALCRRLTALNPAALFIPRKVDYDLTREEAVVRLYADARPDVVIHLAAEVGGIGANREHPGRFFHANLAMGLHLIEQARRYGVSKFVQIGTVCAYPKHCPTPFRESDLWNGYPEETNAPYGIAKRTLSVMLDAYRREYGFNGIFVIPVNLYGPGDNFDPHTSHVIPALIRKFAEAVRQGRPSVQCWGSGGVTREFLYVDDAAEAIVRAAERYDDPAPLNIGTGREIRITDLAKHIARRIGFHGSIEFDPSMPDGQPRRQLDTTRAGELLDWHASTDFDDGLNRTIDWYNRQVVPDTPAAFRMFLSPSS